MKTCKVCGRVTKNYLVTEEDEAELDYLCHIFLDSDRYDGDQQRVWRGRRINGWD